MFVCCEHSVPIEKTCFVMENLIQGYCKFVVISVAVDEIYILVKNTRKNVLWYNYQFMYFHTFGNKVYKIMLRQLPPLHCDAPTTYAYKLHELI